MDEKPKQNCDVSVEVNATWNISHDKVLNDAIYVEVDETLVLMSYNFVIVIILNITLNVEFVMQIKILVYDIFRFILLFY